MVKQKAVSGGLAARRPIGGLVINDAYARVGAEWVCKACMLLPW